MPVDPRVDPNPTFGNRFPLPGLWDGCQRCNWWKNWRSIQVELPHCISKKSKVLQNTELDRLLQLWTKALRIDSGKNSAEKPKSRLKKEIRWVIVSSGLIHMLSLNCSKSEIRPISRNFKSFGKEISGFTPFGLTFPKHRPRFSLRYGGFDGKIPQSF